MFVGRITKSGYYYFLDENECNLIPCHSKAICTNIPGSFDCSCRNGFSGNGTFCQGTNMKLSPAELQWDFNICIIIKIH